MNIYTLIMTSMATFPSPRGPWLRQASWWIFQKFAQHCLLNERYNDIKFNIYTNPKNFKCSMNCVIVSNPNEELCELEFYIRGIHKPQIKSITTVTLDEAEGKCMLFYDIAFVSCKQESRSRVCERLIRYGINVFVCGMIDNPPWLHKLACNTGVKLHVTTVRDFDTNISRYMDMTKGRAANLVRITSRYMGKDMMDHIYDEINTAMILSHGTLPIKVSGNKINNMNTIISLVFKTGSVSSLFISDNSTYVDHTIETYTDECKVPFTLSTGHETTYVERFSVSHISEIRSFLQQVAFGVNTRKNEHDSSRNSRIMRAIKKSISKRGVSVFV